ncbi:MAG: cell division protein FtsL [Pseudomonadota bacterium]|nr:MAG: hypothetical protein DIU72_03675 [Pseudomonadota bacterium]
MNERVREMRLRGAVQTRGVFRDLLIFTALGVLACGVAVIRVEGTRLGYELSRLQSEQNELLREQQALRIELATRRAPHNVEAEARRRLGMVAPSPDRIVRLPSGSPEALEVRASR